MFFIFSLSYYSAMSIDPKLFTAYIQDNINEANNIAKKNSNPEITNVHLAIAMLKEPTGLPYLVCQKAGIDV